MNNTTTFSDNVFKVKTVAEDGTILHGFIKVTDTDPVFSERDTDTERCWPIGNLQKYDYTRKISLSLRLWTIVMVEMVTTLSTLKKQLLCIVWLTHTGVLSSVRHTLPNLSSQLTLCPERYHGVSICGGSSKGSVRQLQLDTSYSRPALGLSLKHLASISSSQA